MPVITLNAPGKPEENFAFQHQRFGDYNVVIFEGELF
jgi:hypothetical protein